MLITKESMFTGKVHTRDIDVTEAQLYAWRTGTMIQDAMPHLTPDEREFIMTGVTPEEWNAEFGADDDAEEHF
jgi:hypothetical protein